VASVLKTQYSVGIRSGIQIDGLEWESTSDERKVNTNRYLSQTQKGLVSFNQRSVHQNAFPFSLN
jgi:hypothetical protein